MISNDWGRNTFRRGSGIILLLGITCIYAYFWYSRFAPAMAMPFYRRGNWFLIFTYALIYFIFSHIYQCDRVGDLRISELIYSNILSLLLCNLISFFQISMLILKIAEVKTFVIFTALQVAITVLWAWGANRVFYHLFPPRKVLMVYGSDQAIMIQDKIKQRPEKYKIVDTISIEATETDLYQKVAAFDSVVLCDIPSPLRNDILKFCFEHSIRAYVTPKISDILIRGAETIQLFDTPLLLHRNCGLSPQHRFLKRCFDLISSTLALILLSPVYLIVAIAIKLEDNGSILFKQERLTEDGRVFTVYKFRSMKEDAESDGIARLATQNDQRITKTGAVIRRLRLDELPQLINIIKGDMSIVGPRPERPEIASAYAQTMPEFCYRLKVKAGLTGYAQVLGRYNTIAYDKLKLDLMYIQDYSFLLDLKIIFMTIKILLMKESTQGVNHLEEQESDKTTV